MAPLKTPLTLISERTRKNPKNPSSVCLSEDDSCMRTFAGVLQGSFSTTYQLCDLNSDGYPAGGIGLGSDVTVIGEFGDLTITAPDGSVHHAELVSSKGRSSRYVVCYCPPYVIATDTGGQPLMGGIWTITLSGDLRTADYWYTRAQMMGVNFQQTFCPISQQNLH